MKGKVNAGRLIVTHLVKLPTTLLQARVDGSLVLAHDYRVARTAYRFSSFLRILTSDGRGVAVPVRREKESSVTTSPKPQGAAADIRGWVAGVGGGPGVMGSRNSNGFLSS
jgi:hypothetical protein